MDLIPGKQAEFVCKLVVIGDAGVGKTSVMRRFVDNKFSFDYVPTIGIDFRLRMMNIAGKYVKVQIWDTAGEERFRSVSTTYYRGAKGLIVAYDITDPKSFENVTNWIVNFERWTGKNVERMLIGNKSDLGENRAVEKEEGEQLAEQSGMLFCETSAKENVNVDHAFMKLLQKIIDKHSKNSERLTEKEGNDHNREATTVSLDKMNDQSNVKRTCCYTSN